MKDDIGIQEDWRKSAQKNTTCFADPKAGYIPITLQTIGFTD